MWGRVVEFMLACWLGVSPFVFGHEPWSWYWITDWTLAVGVGTFSLACFWQPMRWGHFVVLFMATVLVILARFQGTPPLDAAAQNEITTGLLLMMVAVVPNHATVPPVAWLQSETVTPASSPRK